MQDLAGIPKKCLSRSICTVTQCCCNIIGALQKSAHLYTTRWGAVGNLNLVVTDLLQHQSRRIGVIAGWSKAQHVPNSVQKPACIICDVCNEFRVQQLYRGPSLLLRRERQAADHVQGSTQAVHECRSTDDRTKVADTRGILRSLFNVVAQCEALGTLIRWQEGRSAARAQTGAGWQVRPDSASLTASIFSTT